jgi:hypothetical protein
MIGIRRTCDIEANNRKESRIRLEILGFVGLDGPGILENLATGRRGMEKKRTHSFSVSRVRPDPQNQWYTSVQAN